jgi:hypothetical protein
MAVDQLEILGTVVFAVSGVFAVASSCASSPGDPGRNQRAIMTGNKLT